MSMNVYEKLVYINDMTAQMRIRMKGGWTLSPAPKIVFHEETDKGAWIVVSQWQMNKKYYGVDYTGEIIDGVSRKEAEKWVSNFTGRRVNFDKVKMKKL